MNKMVTFRLALSMLFVFAAAGCKGPPKMTDDTLVTSRVNGITLMHRYAVRPPTAFRIINETYRALYPAAIMTHPYFGSNVVDTLKSGESYTVIGRVEGNWLALGEPPQVKAEPQSDAIKDQHEKAALPAEPAAVRLIGYVPLRALVKSGLYEQTLKADQPKRRAPASTKRKNCISIDDDSTACQNSKNGTWIIN